MYIQADLTLQVYTYYMNAKQAANLGRLITRKHERKWVALSKDYTKIVAYSDKLADLEKKLKIDPTEVVFWKVPPADIYLSF